MWCAEEYQEFCLTQDITIASVYGCFDQCLSRCQLLTREGQRKAIYLFHEQAAHAVSYEC
jgi:hypothetical protein